MTASHALGFVFERLFLTFRALGLPALGLIRFSGLWDESPADFIAITDFWLWERPTGFYYSIDAFEIVCKLEVESPPYAALKWSMAFVISFNFCSSSIWSHLSDILCLTSEVTLFYSTLVRSFKLESVTFSWSATCLSCVEKGYAPAFRPFGCCNSTLRDSDEFTIA